MKGIYAKIVEHSISEEGKDIVTFEVRFPRIVLSEWNTHRVFSRNTSSSRAIPIEKLIASIRQDMFMPSYWGKNQKGMQANEELTGIRLWLAKFLWKFAGHTSCLLASTAYKIGLHKQIANRLIENFGYVTVVMTTTEIGNFFALRDHPDAQPEIRILAKKMVREYENSTPKLLKQGEWHLPYITDKDREKYKTDVRNQHQHPNRPTVLLEISAARCASTSFKTVDGKEVTPAVALSIWGKLIGGEIIHASPTEHQATPDKQIDVDIRMPGERKFTRTRVWEEPKFHGNFIGWKQHRKYIPNENMEGKYKYVKNDSPETKKIQNWIDNLDDQKEEK